VVELIPIGRPRPRTTLLDLDTGRSCEIERGDGELLLYRLGERGYVFVDARGDLVWVDLEGQLVEVLVDR
jgi:hypothetical protein